MNHFGSLLRSRWMTGPALAVCVAVATIALTPTDVSAQRQRPPAQFQVLPITLTSVTVVNGALMANGLVGSNAFQTPITLTPRASGGPCPILDLSLGPIDLTLLGLNVRTSPICLEITAVPGGGLLGDLLCEVANLLQGGMSLPDVLALLDARGQLQTLLNGLTSLLDQVLDRLSQNDALVGASCQVLSLAIGPLDLNLLGLVVELDDCANGPVTLDITAIPGGGLLGDLLCSLGDLLNNQQATPQAIRSVLWQITRVLGQLLG